MLVVSWCYRRSTGSGTPPPWRWQPGRPPPARPSLAAPPSRDQRSRTCPASSPAGSWTRHGSGGGQSFRPPFWLIFVNHTKFSDCESSKDSRSIGYIIRSSSNTADRSLCPEDGDAAVGGQEHVEPEVEAAVGQPGQQGGLRAQGEPVQDPRILQTQLRAGHYWYWDWSPWRCWWCSWRGRAACWGRSGCCGGCRGCWSGTCTKPQLCPASWRLAWPVEEVGDQVAAQEAATHQHQGRGLGGGHPPSVWPRPRQRVEAESSTISPALSSRYFNIKLWNYVQFKHLEDKY